MVHEFSYRPIVQLPSSTGWDNMNFARGLTVIYNISAMYYTHHGQFLDLGLFIISNPPSLRFGVSHITKLVVKIRVSR